MPARPKPALTEEETDKRRKIALTKNQVLFYMNQSVDVLPTTAAGALAKHNTLRHFLFFLAEEAPGPITTLLEKARRVAVKASEKKRQVGKEQPAQSGRKRVATMQEGLMQRIKRLKGDHAEEKDGRDFSGGASSSSRYRGVHTADAPPPYTASAGPLDEEGDSSDDGVELAVGEEDQDEEDEEREEGEGEEDDDEEEEEEEKDDDDDDEKEESQAEKQEEGSQEDSDDDQLQKERQGTEESEVVQQVKRSNKPIQEEMLQDFGLRRHTTYNLNAQEMQMHQEALRIIKSMATREEMEARIELGLTRGEPWTLWLVQRTSKILKMPVTNLAFDICKKLDFCNIQTSLVQFHKAQRDQIGSMKLKAPISSPCDIDSPCGIYKVLQEYGATTDVLRIFKAYGQLRLWDSVNKIISKGKKGRDHLKILDSLALSEHSNEKESDRKNKFRDEYHAGARWRDVASVFGGEEVILVFVAAKIGSGIITKSLKPDQREALGELSYYLNGAKKLVTCLGSGSLEYFCRHRYLLKETIADLEKLEPDSHEELGNDGRVETDDDYDE